MTHSCCTSCRLRFTRAAAAVLDSCPSCGDRLSIAGGASELIGFRLAADEPEAQAMAAAMAVALRTPPEDRP